MNSELKANSNVKYYDGFNKEKINSTSKLDFRIFFKTLAIYLDDKLVARFFDIQIHLDSLDNKLILYAHKNKNRVILLEANGTNEEVSKLRVLVQAHNNFSGCKFPLVIDPSKENRDSLLISTKEANLRGFMNLFILFSVLNYWQLIFNNLRKHSTIFKDTVA